MNKRYHTPTIAVQYGKKRILATTLQNCASESSAENVACARQNPTEQKHKQPLNKLKDCILQPAQTLVFFARDSILFFILSERSCLDLYFTATFTFYFLSKTGLLKMI